MSSSLPGTETDIPGGNDSRTLAMWIYLDVKERGTFAFFGSNSASSTACTSSQDDLSILVKDGDLGLQLCNKFEIFFTFKHIIPPSTW